MYASNVDHANTDIKLCTFMFTSSWDVYVCILDAFDREYKLAYKSLLLTDKEFLHIADSPPTPTVMWCRKLFGHLDVT